MIEADIELFQPSPEEERAREVHILKEETLDQFKSRLVDRDRERFKIDYLVDWAVNNHEATNLREVVQFLTTLMEKARWRYPKRSSVDAAFQLIRDGEPYANAAAAVRGA